MNRLRDRMALLADVRHVVAPHQNLAAKLEFASIWTRSTLSPSHIHVYTHVLPMFFQYNAFSVS